MTVLHNLLHIKEKSSKIFKKKEDFSFICRIYNLNNKIDYIWRGEKMYDKQSVIQRIKGGLIVSCQALEDEPLHSSYIMGRLAKAAQMGGAVGIRANSVKDIKAIKETVDLPIIGIIKRKYLQNPIYITPTLREVEELSKVEPELIAFDATARPRPDGKTLEEFIKQARSIYPGLLMADISTLGEGIEVERLGVDIVSTTLSGYTSYTLGRYEKLDYDLIENLSNILRIPVIAEGHIVYPAEARICLERGAFAVVVGSAITRPQVITSRFVEEISKRK